jgi:dienelactone hydrolase
LPALSANHNRVIAPVGSGPYPVACTNIEQDAALIASFGGTPAEDFWEGKPANGQLRYISQILRNPGSVMKMNVAVPDNRSLYTNFASESVEFVVITCHPTPATNFDPGYVLPQTGSIVPHMQAAGTAPKITGDRFPLILFSHGLAGSPISPGHLEALVQLASYGYVVSAVFHGDPRFSRVRIEDLDDFAFLVSRFDEFAEMELLRPLSLKALTDLVLSHPTLSAAVDPERIGAFGASLGGQAVMNLGGAKLTTSISKRCSETARDPRVKAIVGLVPYAGQTFLPAFCDDSSGADTLTVPFLGMSGTRDTTAPISMARQAVNRIPASHYLVEMDIPHEFRPEYASDIFTWTKTFLNAYLKVESDPGAMANLIVMSQVIGGTADLLTIDVHVPFDNQFGEQRVTEMYHPALNHYFMTIDPAEVASILAGGWQATGQSFKGWRQMPAAQFEASPVCRFYGGTVGGPNSHFYTAEPGECDLVRQDPHWFLEGLDFNIHRVSRPDLGCPPGYLKVNRAYNNRWMVNDSNHRFTTSDSTWREMERHGWVLEGAVMCARP